MLFFVAKPPVKFCQAKNMCSTQTTGPGQPNPCCTCLFSSSKHKNRTFRMQSPLVVVETNMLNLTNFDTLSTKKMACNGTSSPYSSHCGLPENKGRRVSPHSLIEKAFPAPFVKTLGSHIQGQMYHDFHKHRYVMEQSGEWSFIPPSVQRRWKIADKRTDAVEKLRMYRAMRRDRFLRIRSLKEMCQRFLVPPNHP